MTISWTEIVIMARDALAKNIAIRKTALSVEQLNSVVQRTIDRILFLRICEDRGIEKYTLMLHNLLEGEHTYARALLGYLVC